LLWFALAVALCVALAIGWGLHSQGVLAKLGGAAPGARAIYDRLIQSGVSEPYAKRAVLAILSADPKPVEPLEYWTPPAKRQVQMLLANFERDDRVRDALLREFGPQAKEDRAFAAVFRPYDRELPTFSADTQVKLQEISLEKVRAALNAGAADSGLSASRLPRDIEAVAGLLSDKENYEYVLRESPLATMLAASEFDFTEKEFREVFRIVAKAEPESVMGGTTASVQEALATPTVRDSLTVALGAGRYAQFHRSRDMAYVVLQRLAALKNIPRDKLDQSYEILTAQSAGDGKISATPNLGMVSPPKELETLLGPVNAADVYRIYLRARQMPSFGTTVAPAPDVRIPGHPVRISRRPLE